MSHRHLLHNTEPQTRTKLRSCVCYLIRSIHVQCIQWMPSHFSNLAGPEDSLYYIEIQYEHTACIHKKRLVRAFTRMVAQQRHEMTAIRGGKL